MITATYSLLSFIFKWGVYGLSLYFSWKDSIRLIKFTSKVVYNFSSHMRVSNTILYIMDDYFN